MIDFPSFGNVIPDSVELHYSLSAVSLQLPYSLNSYRSLYPQVVEDGSGKLFVLFMKLKSSLLMSDIVIFSNADFAFSSEPGGIRFSRKPDADFLSGVDMTEVSKEFCSLQLFFSSSVLKSRIASSSKPFRGCKSLW